MHVSRLVQQGEKRHREPKSICVTVSEKESVTNLTGTMSFCPISRGDVGVGGETVRMIKSYRTAIHILKALKSRRKNLPSLGRLQH